jgi:hypothetical protein
MMPQRKNLWYSLFLFMGGSLLIRISFYIMQKPAAIIVLVSGVLLIFAALYVFWINFRE